jgi:pyruvate formate lyase activating enzyme
VTNGYATEDAIKKISKFLDAMTVDFKASGNSGFYKKYMGVPSVDPIYDLLEYAVKQRIFVEVTNLIIPQLGDDVERCRDLAQWINDALGAEVPFHIIQFFPAHRMTDLPPTPVETLEECALAAKEAGLRYVYVGNVPGHPSESTYCHNCGELLIQREGFRVLRMNLLNQRRCPTCGFKLNILI